MAEDKKNAPEKLPLTPDVIEELVETKEKAPEIPKKNRILPWIILGLIISVILIGIGMIVWSLIKNRPADITINAPLTSPTPIPTPKGETTTLVSPDILLNPTPYRNEQAGFEIRIPDGWMIDDSGNSSATVVFTDPKTTIASGSALLTFISVSVGTASGSLNTEVQDAKDGMLALFDSYTIEEDKDLVLGGKTYHLIGGTYMLNNVKIRNRNLILLNNNVGYAISATSPDISWSQNELLLNASIFSFNLI